MLSTRAIVGLCFAATFVFFIFALVAFNSGGWEPPNIVATSAKMEVAFTWTLRAFGSLLAIIAAIHIVRFAGRRELIDYVVPAAVALLGTLLLAGQQHWVTVLAFALLTLALLVQQLVMRLVLYSREKPSDASPPSDAAGATDIRVGPE
jgi:hypothetical protein